MFFSRLHFCSNNYSTDYGTCISKVCGCCAQLVRGPKFKMAKRKLKFIVIISVLMLTLYLLLNFIIVWIEVRVHPIGFTTTRVALTDTKSERPFRETSTANDSNTIGQQVKVLKPNEIQKSRIEDFSGDLKVSFYFYHCMLSSKGLCPDYHFIVIPIAFALK